MEYGGNTERKDFDAVKRFWCKVKYNSLFCCAWFAGG